MNDQSHSKRAKAARKRLWIGALALVALMALAGVWTLTPARELIQPQAWLSTLASFQEHPAAPWVMLGGFLVGMLVMLPVTVMIVLTIAVFGALEGFFYALTATTFSGLTSFAIGRALGRQQIDRLAGSRVHDLSLKLSRSGVTAVAAVRMLPITHFTVVSLVAGATHIRIRDFVAGTVLGMAPGTGAIAVFFNQVGIAASQPGLEHLLWLGALSLTLLAGLFYLRRLTQGR